MMRFQTICIFWRFEYKLKGLVGEKGGTNFKTLKQDKELFSLIELMTEVLEIDTNYVESSHGRVKRQVTRFSY